MYLSFLSDFEHIDGKIATLIPLFRQIDDFGDDNLAPIFLKTDFINDGFI